jgi:hypothetical protein
LSAAADSWWAEPVELPPEPPPEAQAREPTDAVGADGTDTFGEAPTAIPLGVAGVAEPQPARGFGQPALPALLELQKAHTTPSPSPAPHEDDETGPRAIDPVGATALFLACAALLCASVSWLCVAVAPLGGVALLAGAIALYRTIRWRRSRLTFPAAGTGVAAAVVITALVFPTLLGPTYRGFKDQGVVDPTAIRRIPLPGSPADTDAEDGEWADASRMALQQGQVTIQVDEVAVEEVEIGATSGKKGKGTVCLVIRLRVQSNSASVATAQAGGATLKDEHRPTLTDTAGKGYPLLDVQTAGAAPKGRGVSEFGLGLRLLVFEAPAAGVAGLRLEIPAAAWGGSGAFRFDIPGRMIRRKAP